MTELVTGEAVAVDLRPAKVGSRLVAAAMDFVLQAALLWGLLIVFVATGAAPSGGYGVALSILMFLFAFVGYPVLFEQLWRGRTPGKAAMGLRVVRDDGGPVRMRHSLVRALLWVFADFLLTSGVVGLVTSLASKRGKRLGDLLAGTFVLQERVPAKVTPAVPMPPQLDAWARTLDLSRLPDDLALAAREYLGRAGQLSHAARYQIGAQLAHAVGSVVSPAPPAGTPEWAFLAAVVAERRRRDTARMQAEAARAGWGAQQPGSWSPQPPTFGPSGWQQPSYGPPPVVGPPPAVPGPPADPGAAPVPPPPDPVPAPPPTPPGFAPPA